MTGQKFEFTDQLVQTTCCSCGVVFAIPETLDDRLRESHRTFHCPNGHEISYTYQTDGEKWKEKWDFAKDEIGRKDQDIIDLGNQNRSLRGRITKLTKSRKK